MNFQDADSAGTLGKRLAQWSIDGTQAMPGYALDYDGQIGGDSGVIHNRL